MAVAPTPPHSEDLEPQVEGHGVELIPQPMSAVERRRWTRRTETVRARFGRETGPPVRRRRPSAVDLTAAGRHAEVPIHRRRRLCPLSRVQGAQIRVRSAEEGRRARVVVATRDEVRRAGD